MLMSDINKSKKTSKTPWQSLTTPDQYMSASGYVIDSFFYYNHKYRNLDYKKTKLYNPHMFKIINKFLKIYSPTVMVEALRRSKMKTLKDYGLIQWYANEEQKKVNRIDKDKDDTEAQDINTDVDDLRKDIVLKKSRSKLDMLEDL